MINPTVHKQISKIIKSNLAGNISKLLTGAVVAQLLTFAASPIITRIYGPAAVGAQGAFVSLVTMTSVIFALGYPYAIVLPKRDIEARIITKISLISSIALLIVLTTIILIAEDQIIRVLNAPALRENLVLVPSASFAVCISIISGQWLARRGQFGRSARATAYGSLISNLLKVTAGPLFPSSRTLVISYIINYLAISAIGSPKNILNQRRSTYAPRRYLRPIALKYGDFATLRTPQALLSACSIGLPIIIITALSGPEAAGQYSIALSILFLPVNLFGSALNSAFYPRVTELLRQKADVVPIIKKATGLAFLIGVPGYTAGALLGPVIFPLIFGQQWVQSGAFAQALAPMLLFQFATRPVVASIPAIRLQGMLLKHEIITALIRVSSLWAAFAAFKNPVSAVAVFSLASAAMYFILYLITLISAKEKAEGSP